MTKFILRVVFLFGNNIYFKYSFFLCLFIYAPSLFKGFQDTNVAVDNHNVHMTIQPLALPNKVKYCTHNIDLLSTVSKIDTESLSVLFTDIVRFLPGCSSYTQLVGGKFSGQGLNAKTFSTWLGAPYIFQSVDWDSNRLLAAEAPRDQSVLAVDGNSSCEAHDCVKPKQRYTTNTGYIDDARPATDEQTAIEAVSAVQLIAAAQDEELEFDLDAILQHSGLSRMQAESVVNQGIVSGDYLFDISINGRSLGQDWVRFADNDFCFLGRALLERYLIAELFLGAENCTYLDKSIVTLQHDPLVQKLNLIMPEKALLATGEYYQRGGKGAAINYSVNHRSGFGASDVSLTGTADLKFFSHNWIMQSRMSYLSDDLRFDDFFVRRDLVDMGLQFLAGRIVSNGFALGGYRFDGIRLSTNMHQLRNSLAGEVSGNVAMPATIKIEQGGALLYETMVPAGDYYLSRFSLRNSSTPLTVTEQFADGSLNNFEVPARLALPEYFVQPTSGLPEYYLSLGETIDKNLMFVNAGITFDTQDKPIQHALDLALFSSDMFNLGYKIGYSAEDFQAHLSYRGSYRYDNENFILGHQLFGNISWSLGRSAIFLGTQFNSQDYIDPLQESVLSTSSPASNVGLAENAEQPDMPEQTSYNINTLKFSVNMGVSSPLPGASYHSINTSWYWQRTHADTESQSLSIGLSGRFYDVSYSLRLIKALNSSMDETFRLDFRIPFGNDSRYFFSQSYQDSKSRRNITNQFYGRRQNYSYNLNHNRDLDTDSSGFAAGIQAQTPFTNLSANYGYQASSKQHSLFMSASGSAAASTETFAIGSEQVGDALVFVRSKNIDTGTPISGIPIEGQYGMPYLSSQLAYRATPYKESVVSIDHDLLRPSQQAMFGRTKVKPMAGTVLHEDFLIREMSRILLTVQYNGEPAPPLSHLFKENGDFVGVTDKFGQLFLTDTRNTQNRYFLELPNGTECELMIKIEDSVGLPTSDFFKRGFAICQ